MLYQARQTKTEDIGKLRILHPALLEISKNLYFQYAILYFWSLKWNFAKIIITSTNQSYKIFFKCCFLPLSYTYAGQLLSYDRWFLDNCFRISKWTTHDYILDLLGILIEPYYSPMTVVVVHMVVCVSKVRTAEDGFEQAMLQFTTNDDIW